MRTACRIAAQLCLLAILNAPILSFADDDLQIKEALWLADHDKLEHQVITWAVGDVNLEKISIDQVAEYLRHQTRLIDPNHQGINFVVKSTPELHAMTFTVNLHNATVADVLKQLPMVDYTIGDFTVELGDSWGDRMFSRTFHVPDNALAINPSMLIDNEKQTYDVKSLFEIKGVRFPPGTSATYDLHAKSLTLVMDSRKDFVHIDKLLVYGFKNVP